MPKIPSLTELRDRQKKELSLKFIEKQALLSAAGRIKTKFTSKVNKPLKERKLLDENGQITDLGWRALEKVGVKR